MAKLSCVKTTDPGFWESRYRAGKTPWDFQGVPRALIAYLKIAKPGRVLIPGCGSGYEIRAFAERGWDVLAVDFSEAAVERARAALGELGERVLLADFFKQDFGGSQFDLIYERTFLCSLPPEKWSDYVRRVTDLLLPAGRLAGFFLYGQEKEPPPFPLSIEAAHRIFGEGFTQIADEPVADSLPLFAGRERWQVWERKR
jgi:SAM-dependent methyltransferase